MTKDFNEKDAIEIWKKLKVGYLHFNFSCGGDSMNDTNIEIYDEDGGTIENDNEDSKYLCDFIDIVIYDKVDFYVNSDGHYIGEYGTVVISLNLDDDEPTFSYSKDATSEWEEWVTTTEYVLFSDEEANFIKEHISNINGDEGFNTTFNYKKDCLLDEKKEALLESIKEKIIDVALSAEAPEQEGEIIGDYTRFSTNNDEDDETDIVVTSDNKVKFYITLLYRIERESD